MLDYTRLTGSQLKGYLAQRDLGERGTTQILVKRLEDFDKRIPRTFVNELFSENNNGFGTPGSERFLVITYPSFWIRTQELLKTLYPDYTRSPCKAVRARMICDESHFDPTWPKFQMTEIIKNVPGGNLYWWGVSSIPCENRPRDLAPTIQALVKYQLPRDRKWTEHSDLMWAPRIHDIDREYMLLRR